MTSAVHTCWKFRKKNNKSGIDRVATQACRNWLPDFMTVVSTICFLLPFFLSSSTFLCFCRKTLSFDSSWTCKQQRTHLLVSSWFVGLSNKNHMFSHKEEDLTSWRWHVVDVQSKRQSPSSSPFHFALWQMVHCNCLLLVSSNCVLCFDDDISFFCATLLLAICFAPVAAQQQAGWCPCHWIHSSSDCWIGSLLATLQLQLCHIMSAAEDLITVANDQPAKLNGRSTPNWPSSTCYLSNTHSAPAIRFGD